MSRPTATPPVVPPPAHGGAPIATSAAGSNAGAGAIALPGPFPAPGAEVRIAIVRRPLALALGCCVLLAALTLLAPFAPTYDPWAWIVWGREVAHLDLSTSFGPSWKPLPVALTTVFALFGSAGPALWVLAARAGALAGALFAFRLGRRLGGPVAGALAGAALLAAPWYLRSAALANSEGLQVAFALAAIERALAGRRPQAFALAVGLGLLRPEAWPFVGLFGAWLVHAERERLGLVLAGLASLPVLWLVPERIGSGDWLRAAHRAQQPVGGGPSAAANPLAEILREAWLMLDRPLRWAFVIAVVVAVGRRDRRFALLGALAGAWALLVAAMTAHGYSGNERYLMVPAALAIVLAAAGAVTAARALVHVARRRLRIAAPGPLVAAALALAGGLALGAWVVSPWIAPARRTIAATSWQARMIGQLGPLIADAGGPARLRACGTPVTGAYLVPALAWHLGVHLSQVQLVATAPGTVFRVHTTRGAAAIPTLTPLTGTHGLRTLARSADWRIVSDCEGP